jgi:UDP-2,4-diacetamido-2,4,6-trideoxy-beta-L-altropyranose hydrolase
VKNILFRADSSSTIGTGHIMRDLVLAEQFEDTNIIFATQDLPGNINYKIEEKNYVIEILNSNNIDELTNIIEKYSIEMIIIDHYGIDHNYEKALKAITGVMIFVLDDTYEKHHCDILLNHNIYADSSRYKNLVPEYCKLRCGAKFTLLREEFKSEKTKQKKSAHCNGWRGSF